MAFEQESDDDVFETRKVRPSRTGRKRENIAPENCPICGTSLALFDVLAAQNHANKCLDSNADASLSRTSVNAFDLLLARSSSSPSVPGKKASKRKAPSAASLKTKTKQKVNHAINPNVDVIAAVPALKPDVDHLTFSTSIIDASSVSVSKTEVVIQSLESSHIIEANVSISSEGGSAAAVDNLDESMAVLDRTLSSESYQSLDAVEAVFWDTGAQGSFLSEDSKATEQSTDASSSTGASWNRNTSNRACPWYKLLPNTSFSIDAFSYGKIASCTGYFLSHFHADHYGGLTSKFSHGPIYCSKVTANLVKSQLRVDEKYIVEIPMNTKVLIEGVGVTLIDANHCPGAVLFLFEVPNPASPTAPPFKHLHTGDFRAVPFHTTHPLLKNERFTSLYLDTTYCDARYAFPSQTRVLQVLGDVIDEVVVQGKKLEDVIRSKEGAKNAAGQAMMRQFLAMGGNTVVHAAVAGVSALLGTTKRKTLVCVGTYTIGKERVFKMIAQRLGSKVYAETAKLKILSKLEDAELDDMLVDSPLSADVHVMKIGQLNKEDLEKKLQSVSSHFSRIIAIRPTGWTHNPSGLRGIGKPDAASRPVITPPTEFTAQSMKLQRISANIHVIPIPYSEHSSYTELKEFVCALSAEKIIPTVNVRHHEMMRQMFEEWQMEGK
ncbi:DNA break repair nuclease [Chytriomyces hyalinus]|nr:DNA break repair nuclease [Chytriomyces hyalinus]